ncbi:SMP-30/gluconolactonase/LRE family protein [Yinghuangia soli]|uniref:SMP-30/gluconolactonase/LRE family protein n=1 Tax=Yinghuangia soli TaxID=2908204 RepID=A0AA41Q415_9ACTN|nr:SMP-30/gluconolactonase/LRE family protein [Yinghuangia soli]MCF2531143.1 SMP-30/gluconolactonase/LRE family protein [Yinghuangia soli]
MTGDLHEAVRADAALGEGPTWDPAAQHLLWVDILGSRIHTFDPASGRTGELTTDQHVGAVKPRAAGGLVANLRDGVGLYDVHGDFTWLLHRPVPGRRGNDAAIGPDGALWAGTMRYDEAPGGGSLFRVTADGSADTVLDGVTVSNGIAWSGDHRLMYYVDSPTRRIDVFTYADGHAYERRPWVEIEPGAGFPDGITVDADGAVWVALWDGAAVRRYTPDGRLDRTVDLPVLRPTACAFGGVGLNDLYITTARTGIADPHPLCGSLLVIGDAGHGLPQPPFAG